MTKQALEHALAVLEPVVFAFELQHPRAHCLAADDIALDAQCDRGSLVDQRGGNAQLGQRGSEIFHHGVEVQFGEIHPSMRGAHVLARVRVRTAERERQERLLLGALPVHVDVVEKARDALVGQHLAIENVDRGIDRCLTTESVVDGSAHVSSSFPDLRRVWRTLAHARRRAENWYIKYLFWSIAKVCSP